MKEFNTAGTCRPNEHYMVDITERLEIIREMIAKGMEADLTHGYIKEKVTPVEISTKMHKLYLQSYCFNVEAIV